MFLSSSCGLLQRFMLAPAVALLLCGMASAQGVLVSPPRPTGPPANALSSAATNIGLKRCLPALERLSSLAVQGSRSHDVLLDWDRKRGDASPIFSMLGVEYPNAGAAMSITAIPEADGACSVSAERISVAPFTCQSVAQQELVGYQATRLLPNFVVYTDSKDRSSSVSLIDSPPGCLVIRRFVAFGWKAPIATGPFPR